MRYFFHQKEKCTLRYILRPFKHFSSTKSCSFICSAFIVIKSVSANIGRVNIFVIFPPSLYVFLLVEISGQMQKYLPTMFIFTSIQKSSINHLKIFLACNCKSVVTCDKLIAVYFIFCLIYFHIEL